MIKVIIERHIAEGMESTYEQIMKNMLRTMVEAPGYTSGVNYKDAKNSLHRVIITNWQDEAAWDMWKHTEQRAALLAAIKPILMGEEKITILTA
ncbi:MAG: antibiotic biosynthesis monooxygenase [Oceanospirillaceae bacterium]|nr:antibiotic biosynthesis monooxygenase [Oceanospirillaceae bacterium]MBT14035.1 antibiotic biosynthesis monooxygenase [Oceanospirillaceae bacterium]|tara:strand:- start:73437 stop:73718 length:282 start_codon:yes stop_codon:yes gene_type:complete